MSKLQVDGTGILAIVMSGATCMQPTLVREPFHRQGWIYEEKYDGWRRLAFKDGKRVRLVSRNSVDHTERFQNIAAAIYQLPSERVILDGEVCSFDENLVSQFQYLPVPPPEVHATPPVFMVFDCLSDGRDIRAEPLARRREALEAAIDWRVAVPRPPAAAARARRLDHGEATRL